MFWVSVVLAVPFTYASLYVAEGGTRDAEGCSGAGPMLETGVTGLYAETEEQVASDAFVMITAEVRNVDVETALSSLTLEVRDAAGNLVEGSTEVLRDHVVTAGLSHVSIGWWADAAREPGEVLALRASATNNVRSVELVSQLAVHDLDPILVLPEFQLTGWLDVVRDTGATQVCPSTDGSCGQRFGTETEAGRSLALSAASVSEVVVGWEYRFEEVPGKGVFARTPPLYDANPDASFTPTLEFSGVLPEYCVRLVGRDLRTEEELSREWCGAPAPPFEAVSSDAITNCMTPPAGFEERWCRVKKANGAILPECSAILDPSGGAGGEPGASGAGSGGSGEQPPGQGAGSAETTGDASSSTVRTNAGCGCRAGHHPTPPAAALLVLAGAWIARARRRTSRSRATV